MSSTNKTTNYKLSQYIGTDKPTYLGDYNGDMLKIDNQMKVNADSASNATAAASAAKAVAEKASKDVQALNNSVSANSEDIASLKTKNAQQDVSIQNASNSASSALNKAKQNEHNIADINTRNQWIQGTNIHNTGLPNYTKGSWNCSYNRLSGLLNISGQIELSQGSTIASESRIATIPSDIMKLINPSGERKIWSSVFVTRADGSLEVQNLTIDQTGKIYMAYTLNNVTYMNTQLTLNTSTWNL
ncbi:MAG: hypothetical protein [Bacteriophage sp.]|nr:MAG: hypothetical protein [Bacteriophage sp.]